MPSTSTFTMPIAANLGRLMTAAGAVAGLSAMAVPSPALAEPGFANGTYLFGESAEASTIGSTYFVFEINDSAITGALYQPSSSFDCVQGQVVDGEMQLVITNAYDQTQHPYTVALTSSATAVASQAGGRPTTQIQGMQPISQLSDLDRELLGRCAIQ